MGLFDILFGGKNNSQKNQDSADYVRVNLFAKLGEENLKDGNYQEAINYIHEFFELMNRNSYKDLRHLIKPCYFNLALAYSNSEDYANAIIYWTKFIHYDKSNFDAYSKRIQAYFELNRFPEALQDIDKALRLKPNQAELYINKGIAYIKMGDKLKAKKALIRANDLGNTDAQNLINKYC